jgi:hypothetical protein
MAYDEGLDAHVEEIATAWGASRKKMFGGTCCLAHGNMMAGAGPRLRGRPAAEVGGES